MKQLIAGKDSRSTPNWMTEITDAGYTGRVAADTDISVSVPAGSAWAVISADDHFFVSAAAVTLPSVGVVSQTDTEMDKDQIAIPVSGLTTLHIRGRNEMDFSVAFWR